MIIHNKTKKKNSHKDTKAPACLRVFVARKQKGVP
jgi:hypothetical protein